MQKLVKFRPVRPGKDGHVMSTRVLPGTLDRVWDVLRPGERPADFLRWAVDAELSVREKKRKRQDAET